MKTRKKRIKLQAVAAEIVETMLDGVNITDVDGTILDANLASARLYGFNRPEELIGKSIFDFIPLRELTLAREKFRKHTESGIALENPELMIARKDGSEFPAVLMITNLCDEEGEMLGNVAIIRDITIYKKIEEALKKSEEYYRALIDTTDTGFVIIDTGGRVIDANQEYVRLTGHRNIEEIRGRSVIEWTAGYEAEKNAMAVEKCKKDGYIRNLEIDYVDAEGRVTPIEINATVVEKVGVPQILTLCRDISLRRRAQKEAQESAKAKSAQEIMDAMVEGVAVINLEGTIVQENRALAELHGYKTVVGKKVVELLSEEDIPGVAELFKRLTITGEELRDLEVTDVACDGRRFPVMVNQKTMRNEHGQIEKFTAVVRDVTELKRAGELLRNAETGRKTREIMEAMIDGVYSIDLNGIITGENRASAKLFEYNTVVGKSISELMSREDSMRATLEIKKLIDTGVPISDFEFMGITSSGRRFPVLAGSAPLRNENGVISGIIGIARDITDLKKIQEEKTRAAVAEAEALAEKRNAGDLRAVNQQLKETNQQLRAKEKALQASQEELHKKIIDLEKLNRLMVGRELKMIELKERIKELEGE